MGFGKSKAVNKEEDLTKDERLQKELDRISQLKKQIAELEGEVEEPPIVEAVSEEVEEPVTEEPTTEEPVVEEPKKEKVTVNQVLVNHEDRITNLEAKMFRAGVN